MPSVHLTQVLAAAGFDWLLFDMERGPIGAEAAHAMVTATHGTGLRADCEGAVRASASWRAVIAIAERRSDVR